jgi:hypothetical protein
MAYNRENFLLRVLKMQREVIEIQEKHHGIPMTVIYRDYIRANYAISYSTFCNWLGIPAERELRRLKQKEKN